MQDETYVWFWRQPVNERQRKLSPLRITIPLDQPCIARKLHYWLVKERWTRRVEACSFSSSSSSIEFCNNKQQYHLVCSSSASLNSKRHNFNQDWPKQHWPIKSKWGCFTALIWTSLIAGLKSYYARLNLICSSLNGGQLLMKEVSGERGERVYMQIGGSFWGIFVLLFILVIRSFNTKSRRGERFKRMRR